ncbi:family 43 glycosylhydrolase [Streptomyces sp. NPDC057067]|uniref:family 43 glycosylhydrolase n=1 Tax=Streptomyces TaxID=1883 RepID=UPI001922D880|nr:family 43 glycosylhydrolase [Streptomyces silvae]MBL1285430.1 family 43 glycosylhydrolase [Streptomyces silvae]
MVRIIRKLSVALASAALLLGFAPSPAGAGQQGPVRTAAPPVHSTSEAGNPLVEGWYADPDVAVYGDRFWIYPTTSRSYGEQTFMDAFSSTDMVHWTKHPKVLDIADVPWAKYALWAPAPVYRDGKYYLYFAANDIQSDSEVGGIGVAVSDRPEGPYKDAIGAPLIDRFHNGAQPIDQDVFIDDDGQAYMYYGGWGHANVVKLNPDMTSLGTFPDGTVHKEITPENYTEGSFMFKRGGTYYMMWSEGGWTGPDYSVSYAMSDSPTGPFEKIDRVLAQDPAVARGSGHNSVVNVPGTDVWYIVYHRRPLSETDGNHRALAYDRMYFNEDGTIRPVTMKVQDNFEDGNAVGWRTYGGGDWTAAHGTYSVTPAASATSVTSAASATSVTSASGGLALQDTDFSDLVYEADVTLRDGRGEAGLAFRATPPEAGEEGFHGYYAALTAKGLVLGKAAGGERTPLATARLANASGSTHRVRIEAIGSSLKVYVDDLAKPRISTTDSTYASGSNGVHATRPSSKPGSAAERKPLASFDDVAIRSDVFSFEAADAPNRFIRHAWSRGRVDPDVTPYADMQWKVVPGLADPSAVSLESVNFPGHFLRQRDGEVWSEARTDDAGFLADATWRRVPGLSDRSLTSFESISSPGRYLRHRDALLYAERVAPGERPGATFREW